MDAVVREMKEETGLKIFNPRLCGVKQFPIEDGRYIVFLFETEEFEGKVVSSEEGKMEWVNRTELANRNIVKDLPELIQVMVDDKLTEFQYVIEDEKWNVILK